MERWHCGRQELANYVNQLFNVSDPKSVPDQGASDIAHTKFGDPEYDQFSQPSPAECRSYVRDISPQRDGRRDTAVTRWGVRGTVIGRG